MSEKEYRRGYADGYNAAIEDLQRMKKCRMDWVSILRALEGHCDDEVGFWRWCCTEITVMPPKWPDAFKPPTPPPSAPPPPRPLPGVTP